MPRRPASVRAALLLAGPLLLGLTACGGAAVQGTVESEAPTAPASSSAPSASPSSSTPEPVEESSSAEETALPTVELVLPKLAGYDYADAPGDFDSIAETLTDTGMVDGVTVAGVKGSGSDLAAVVIAAQYNQTLVDAFARMSAKSVLRTVAAGAKPSLTGKVTQKYTTVDGTDLLLLSTPTVSVAIAYFDDGLLTQMYGPDQASLLRIATAFITAKNAGK